MEADLSLFQRLKGQLHAVAPREGQRSVKRRAVKIRQSILQNAWTLDMTQEYLYLQPSPQSSSSVSWMGSPTLTRWEGTNQCIPLFIRSPYSVVLSFDTNLIGSRFHCSFSFYNGRRQSVLDALERVAMIT